MAKKPDSPGPGEVKTLREVAKAFGKSVKTIADWRSGGMPGSRGHWNLIDIKAWDDERRADPVSLSDDLDDDSSVPGASKSPALEKLRTQKARLAELDVLQREGELLPVVEHQQIWATRVVMFRHALRSLAKKIAPDNPALRKVINRHVDKLLRDLATEMPSVPVEMVSQLFEFLGLDGGGGDGDPS